jgi:hypothetical protein
LEEVLKRLPLRQINMAENNCALNILIYMQTVEEEVVSK